MDGPGRRPPARMAGRRRRSPMNPNMEEEIALRLQEEHRALTQLNQVLKEHIAAMPSVNVGPWLDGLRTAFERLHAHVKRSIDDEGQRTATWRRFSRSARPWPTRSPRSRPKTASSSSMCGRHPQRSGRGPLRGSPARRRRLCPHPALHRHHRPARAAREHDRPVRLQPGTRQRLTSHQQRPAVPDVFGIDRPVCVPDV
jgi:hypothetical protein